MASPGIAPPAAYQSIFDDALVAYRKKMRKDLTLDPLLRRLKVCKSLDDINTFESKLRVTVLSGQSG